MKTLAVALTQLVLAVVVANSLACASAPKKRVAHVNEDEAAREALVKELNALVAQGPLYFETDTDSLTDESQILLQRIALQMHRVSKVRVTIGGHADERGDTSYNLALGERRGYAARDYLVRMGIPKQRIVVVSLGEEQPIVAEHNEDAWAQNRRDEFRFLLPGEHKSVLNIGLDDDETAGSEGDVVASATPASEE